MTDEMPEEDDWKMLKRDSWSFEMELEENCVKLKGKEVSEAQIQDYCFSMRELMRLFGAWYKYQKNHNNRKTGVIYGRIAFAEYVT